MKKKHPSLSIEALAVILLVLVSAGLTWASTITNNTTSSALTWPGLTSNNVTAPTTFDISNIITQPLTNNVENTTSEGNVIIPPTTIDIWDTTGSTESATGCCSKRVVNGKTSGICVKGTGCPDNPCSNIGGACGNYKKDSGGNGGSGGGTTPTPTPTPTPVDPDNDGKHWACVPVSYGTIAYKCIEVNGEAEDTCGGASGGTKGPCLDKEPGTPADYYYACNKDNKCVPVANKEGERGRSSCTTNADCTKNVFTSVGNSIGAFFVVVWSTVLSWFGR